MKPTPHGDNIANQIQTEDAYGQFNPLNITDLWAILDNFETHVLDYPKIEHQAAISKLLSKWKTELEDVDPDVLDAI